MRSLIQLVTHAEVTIAKKTVGAISHGILALIGIEKNDTEEDAKKLFDRMLRYRIFPDNEGKMNLDLKSVEGGILLVPQFTLVAETTKGNRPSFSSGMRASEGKRLFDFLVSYAKQNYPYVETGQFGAYMLVTLCNDGPVTFLLTTK